MNYEIDNKINLVPSSDDDRDWILDSYYVGYYKKNWINPKIEYELADRVILQGNYNYKENPSVLNIEETINIIKEWFNFQYFHNKLNSITNLKTPRIISPEAYVESRFEIQPLIPSLPALCILYDSCSLKYNYPFLELFIVVIYYL